MNNVMYIHDQSSAGTHDLSERLNFSFTLYTYFLPVSILPFLLSWSSICYLTTLASQSKIATVFPTLRASDSGKKALTRPV